MTNGQQQQPGPGQQDAPITTKHGLLYRNAKPIPLPEADHIARAHGYLYAEHFVRALEQKKTK